MRGRSFQSARARRRRSARRHRRTTTATSRRGARGRCGQLGSGRSRSAAGSTVRPAVDGSELRARYDIWRRGTRAAHRSARARSASAHRGDDGMGQHRYRRRGHAPRRQSVRAQAVGKRGAHSDHSARGERRSRASQGRRVGGARARRRTGHSARTASFVDA